MGTKKLIKKMKKKQAQDMKMSPTGTKIFREIASHLSLIGTCHCGKPLFCYLRDTDHPFNAYCLECGSITDVRFPKTGDSYKTEKVAPTPVDIIKVLYNNNTDFKVTDDLVKSLPIDTDVNEI